MFLELVLLYIFSSRSLSLSPRQNSTFKSKTKYKTHGVKYFYSCSKVQGTIHQIPNIIIHFAQYLLVNIQEEELTKM